jgi:hypothetical protein
MKDLSTHIILGISVIALTISMFNRLRPGPPIAASDNGIVPPELLESISHANSILDRRIVPSMTNVPDMQTAVAVLSAASNTEIIVNWSTLEGAGIDRNVPTHVHFHGGTLRRALERLCDDVGGGTMGLNYQVDGDTVVISTVEDISKDCTTEIYNLRPLIAQIKASAARTCNQQDLTVEEIIEDITRMITYVIDPDVWRSAGGSVASIRELGGLLIVTQTAENQRQIAALLTRLDVEMKK